MKVGQLRQIIRESINDRIKNIDHAGNIGSVRAKLDQINKDMEEINQIKNDYSNIQNLEHYVDPKVLKAFGANLDKSLGGLEKSKNKVQAELDKLENGKVKKTSEKELGDSAGENIDLGDSGEEEVEDEPKKQQVAEARKRRK